MPSAPTATVLEPGRGRGAMLLGVACVSASGLVLEVALTRVFAVTQFYHFAFLTVSMALLGLGAGGSALTSLPRLGKGGPRRWMAWAALQGIATLVAYAGTDALPFDSFAIAWDRTQIIYLAAIYLGLAIPFFFGGLIVGAMLSADAAPPSHLVYAANLAGSGVGCVAAMAALDRLGGEGTIGLSAAVAMAGAAAFAGRVGDRRILAVTTVATGLLILTAVAVPAPLRMTLSPYKDLPSVLRYPEATIRETVWDRGTRIDLVESKGIRSLPGLSYGYLGAPPPQDGLTFDGDELSPVPRVSLEEAGFVPHLLGSLPFRLRPGGKALVLEPRGGLDVLVGRAAGAGRVVAVEPHGRAVEVARSGGASPYDLLGVEVVEADPRAYVESASERFDVIDLALTSPYRPVTSGAYSLVEDYRLTVESFERSLDLLRPGGILTAARWIQNPPSEETRLLALGGESMRRKGLDPEEAIVMVRGYSLALLMVQPDGWSEGELAAVRGFAESERFDLVAAPGLGPDEVNRFNVIPDEGYSELAMSLLSAPDPQAVYAAHSFDITPPTDDRPFFGHFFTWAQAPEVLDSIGRTWQPFGGAGYFVLLAFLGLAVVTAAALILAPLAIQRPSTFRSSGTGSSVLWTLGYFSTLGLAFLFVEIPLVQQYILIVGHPASAFALVLFAILVASGMGSMAAPRVSWRIAGLALVAAAAIYPFILRAIGPFLLTVPPGWRMVAGAGLLSPLGLLMGVMFPSGLAHLERNAPALVPWAWAINGTVSVISAVGAALLALSFGFTTVILVGAGCYAAAGLLAWRAERSSRVGLAGEALLTARLG